MTEEAFDRTMKNISETIAAIDHLPGHIYGDTYRGASLLLRKAIQVHARILEEKIKGNLKFDLMRALGFYQYDLLRQTYDTYLGMNDELPSRFSIAYLASIPRDVLVGFLPIVRRADYLAQAGKFTSVSVTRKSIKVPVILPSKLEVTIRDLRDWCAMQHLEDRIALPYSPDASEVDLGHHEQLQIFDSVVTDEPLPPFVREEIAPIYNASQHLYYNKMRKNLRHLQKYTITRSR